MSLAFDAVFEALHGGPPYAWQSRLCAEVMGTGWPRVIAAPTGAGKTAVLDIALYHLAAQDRGLCRKAPRRIVFAVDRRVVVDQAFERARHVQCRLQEATDSPLLEVKQRLLALAGRQADAPLHVEELRGGLPREDDWARTPTQPTILCTTIDQLGSRLLFRGYGVSPAMAPIHAGLLGNDTLIILDEAHLSQAFSETLDRVLALRSDAEQPLGLPFAVTCLTATPRDAQASFHLRDDERQEAAIRRRLEARKLARLRLGKPVKAAPAAGREAAFVPADGEDDAAGAEQGGGRPDPMPFVKAACEMCAALDSAATIAIVVNRVALARAIFGQLCPAPSEGSDVEPALHDAILLTGRVRPIERDDLIERYRPRLEGRATSDKPLFVVATQCIEAGADFDFDGLVTQIAPLDALAQRFGRLARSGERSAEPAPAVIIALPGDSKAKDDPVYGDKLKVTWDWLNAKAEPVGETGAGRKDQKAEPRVDFGPDAVARLIRADPEGAKRCCTEPKPAPYLRSADLEFWSMTNPAPHPDPHLPLYLHGDPRIDTDVSIVWRADLTDADFEQEGRAIEIVAAMPPRPGEALRLPIQEARRFLAERGGADFADAPGRAEDEEDIGSGRGRKALRWRGDDSEIVEPLDIRPGDTLVVPASYGGCDRFGWAPESSEPVTDIADRAAAPYSAKRLAVRLHPALWAAVAGLEPKVAIDELIPWSEITPLVSSAPASARQVQGWIKKLRELLETARSKSSEGDWRPLEALGQQLASFETRKPRLIWPYRERAEEAPEGVVIVAGAETVESDDSDASSFAERPQSLDEHAGAVVAHASAYAIALGLPEDIAEALTVAARHHDDGKRDPRFQEYLRSAAGFGSVTDGVELAKSGARRPIGEDRRLRAAAGVPSPWRHEVLSAHLFAEHAATLRNEPEVLDLALWLIGTHHGQGRPFFRHTDPWDGGERKIGGQELPADAGPHRLEFAWRGDAWADLFETLERRYGVWGLAFLEAVLRLADHRASEQAEEGPNGKATAQ